MLSNKDRSKRGINRFLLLIALLAAIVLLLDNASRLMFPVKYREYISQYSKKYEVDPYLVLAIIKAESKFNPDAVSHKNARGLMQITLKTGQWGAETLKLPGYDGNSLYDPKINIEIGCWYLGVLSNEFDGNTDLVIAAYNGGSGNVRQWLKNEEYSSNGYSLDKIPFGETERYVKKVNNYLAIYKMLYKDLF